MLNFEITQDTKPLIKDAKGQDYVDLIIKDISIKDIGQLPRGIDYFLVTEDVAMRPDLVSKAMYGYGDMMEKLLKFNNISNPLAIDENDLLIIFDPHNLSKNMRPTTNAASDKDVVRSQYLTPEKASKIDPKLQEFNKREKAKKAEPGATALPPNYAAFGDSEIEIRGGKIYFGPNVTSAAGPVDEPLSKSEYIARLIKNSNNKK